MPAKKFNYILVVLPWIIFLLIGESATAQSDFEQPNSEAPGNDAYWIIETAAMYRFAGQAFHPDEQAYSDEPRYFFSFDLGRMKPKKNRKALGGSIGFAAGSDSWRVGLNFRYRKGFGKRMYLDISPGILFAGTSSMSDMSLPGFSTQVELGLSKYFGLAGRVDILRREKYDHTWTDTSMYAGLKIKSTVGIAAVAVGLIVVAILAGMASSTWS